MYCYKHGEAAAAVAACASCNRHMCADCSVNIDNAYLCKDCVAEMAVSPAQTAGQQTNYKQVGRAHNIYHDRQHLPRGDFSHYHNTQSNVSDNFYYGHGPVRRYRKSGFLLFLFSGLPGLNYMYLGLMKRGLFFMTLFFSMIFVANELGARLLMFAVFILMCFSLFDGFRVRRLLTDGYVVSDAADDVIAFFKKHWKAVALFLGLAVAAGVAGRMSRAAATILSASNTIGRSFNVASDILTFGIGLIIIVAGCYLVAKILTGRNKKND